MLSLHLLGLVNIAELIFGFSVFSMGLYIWAKSEKNTFVNKFCVLTSLTGVYYTLNSLLDFIFYFRLIHIAHLFIKIKNFSGAICLLLSTDFFVTFPKSLSRLQERALYGLLYPVFIVFAFVYLLSDYNIKINAAGQVYKYAAVQPVFAKFLLINTCFIIGVFIYKFLKFDPENKRRYLWFFIGLFQYLLVNLYGNLTFDKSSHSLIRMVFDDTLYQVSIWAVIIIWTYIIFENQLFKIRSAFHYTFFWAILILVSVLPVYFGVLFFDEAMMSFLRQGVSFRFNLFVILVLSFLLIYPYLRYIHPKLDKLFFREKHQYEKQFDALSQRIVTLSTIEALVKLVEDKLETILKSKGVRITLLDRPE